MVDGSTWYAAGPSPCATATCPRRESVVRNRLPFSTAAPTPTDLVLPMSTLADADRVAVLGRGSVLGRPAVRVEVPFERAEPLFPFLSIGGDWRPFFPNDRVHLARRAELVPAAMGGLPGDGRRARRVGPAVRPARRARPAVGVLGVRARRQPRCARRRGVRHPGDDVVAGSGRPVGEARQRAARGRVRAGRSAHGRWSRPVPVVPRDDAGGTLVAYADGLAFLNLGETRTWNGDAPFGPVGVQAEEIPLTGGGVAYYEPSSDDHGRRVSIHAAGTDLYLESNLPRSELLAAAAALPVQGLPMPEAWRLRQIGVATVERVSLEAARASVPFPIELPATLPAGFGLASVELVDAGYGAGVTLYLRDRDADAGIGTIRLHLEAATALPPATSATQSTVDVAGVGDGSRPTARSSNGSGTACIARWTRPGSSSRSCSPSPRRSAPNGTRRADESPPRRGLAAGVAMGFALGASLTLAIQGWANLPDPGSIAVPTVPRTEPQPPRPSSSGPPAACPTGSERPSETWTGSSARWWSRATTRGSTVRGPSRAR